MSATYSEEEIERCTLTGRREILFQIRQLIRQKQRVSVVFDEGRQSFLTVLIDISADDTTLFFDVSGSEESNLAFLRAGRCQFIADVDGIRLQFPGEGQKTAQWSGEQVLAVAIPNSLLRLQRREFFRLRLPTSKPYLCRFRLGSPEEMALPIYDISVGGIGIMVTEKPRFETMEQIERCSLDLRESGLLRVALEIRYIVTIEGRLNRPVWHMGCKFLKLAPASETAIQRFMARIEIERRTMSIT